MKNYGKTKIEKDVEKIIECREIVKRIIDFGVNEFQKIKIIEFLSLELEDRNSLVKINEVCKSILSCEAEENDDKDLQDVKLLLK